MAFARVWPLNNPCQVATDPATLLRDPLNLLSSVVLSVSRASMEYNYGVQL